MDRQLLIIVLLTFIIHLIGTLAYSVRIAGTRTGKIAVSLSIFNILVLISRTSNSFQTPILAKRVESGISSGIISGAESDFRWLLLSASIATIAGAFLIPTFQRLFSKAVEAFSTYRSIPKLVLKGLSPIGLAHIRSSFTIPSIGNITSIKRSERLSFQVIIFNMVAMAIWTVGIFSALYAGYLYPELRTTASQLSGIINGIATILMFVFIDPNLSILTDDVAQGKLSETYLRKSIVWLVGSRLAGTLIAQLLLIPAAYWIIFIAKHI